MLASCLLCACGGGGSGQAPTTASSGSATEQSVPTLSLFAGNFNGSGTADGVGSAARFHYLYGVATDSVGNLFVVDSANSTIRKVTAGGVVTTFAGAAGQVGSTDGAGPIARFKKPNAIVIDGSDNIYVSDAGNASIRKITSDGVVSTLATSVGSSPWPGGLAVDSKGNVFVTNTSTSTSDKAIRVISPQGVVSTLALQGAASGVNYTGSIAIDGADTLYAIGTDNSIGKITLTAANPATGVVTTLQTINHAGAPMNLVNPNKLTIDKNGNLFVEDVGTLDGVNPTNTIYKIATTGITATLAQVSSEEEITGLAVDRFGNVYTTDKYTNTVSKITPSGVVSTLAGAGANQAGSADGTGVAATFSNPIGIATDRVGNVYVVDTGNNIIRKISSAGVVVTLAKGASAGFANPYGAATDSAGNLYIADAASNTIRQINTLDGTVSTYAGVAGPKGGFLDSNSKSTATFNSPVGVAIDSAGNMYVADAGNNAIRLITPDGKVSTYAGGQSGYDDGIGTAARFNSPIGIAVDGAGNVFVSDTGNHTIRMILPSQQVITIAGLPQHIGSADGTMQNADSRFSYPNGLTTDNVGNVYVADNGNSTIRKIARDGTTVRVSTVVGSAGIASFAPGPLPGLLTSPVGVAISGTSLYITMSNGVAVVQNLH